MEDIKNKFTVLVKISDKILKTNNIDVNENIREKILNHISTYLDMIIFNITTLFCIVAIINNSIKLTSEYLEIGKQYLGNKCNISYNAVGGERLGSSAILGLNLPEYKETNITNDILNINFEKNILRPQIGGKSSSNKVNILYLIEMIIKYHGIQSSKNIRENISKIINIHIECFVKELKSIKKPMTCSILNQIIKNHRKIHNIS